MAKPVTPVRERFMSHVQITETCWLWTGSRIGRARRYGGFRVGTRSTDRKQYAHRVSHELFIGPIPDEMVVDHVKARGCTSTLCVRPDHLEAVTEPENWARERLSVCGQGHDMTDPRNVTIDRQGRRRGCAECRRVSARAAYARKKG